MAIIESVARFAGSIVAIIHTRLELAAVEVEEEFLRLFTYLLTALVALFCLGVAVLLAILLIVVLYWETHRVPVLLGLIAAFGLGGIFIGLGIRRDFQKKPRLLASTLGELSKDIDSLKPSAKSSHENAV